MRVSTLPSYLLCPSHCSSQSPRTPPSYQEAEVCLLSHHLAQPHCPCSVGQVPHFQPLPAPLCPSPPSQTSDYLNLLVEVVSFSISECFSCLRLPGSLAWRAHVRSRADHLGLSLRPRYCPLSQFSRRRHSVAAQVLLLAGFSTVWTITAHSPTLHPRPESVTAVVQEAKEA